MLASGSVQEAQDFARDRPCRDARARAFRSCTSSTASAPRTRSRRSSELADDDLRALIDDDADRGAPRSGRCRPTTRSCAARRRTPTSSSRRARPANRFYARLPGRRAGRRWTASPSAPAARYRLFDYVGHPEAERVIVMMGSGAETAARDRRLAGRARREGRPPEGAAVPARSPSPPSPPRCRARVARSPSSTAPRSRARSASRSTRTSWRRSREASADEPASAATASSAGATASPRRSSRRRWSRRSSTSSRQPRAAQPLHRRHRRRRHAHLAALRRATSTSSPTDVVRAVFFGLGSDGTVGANKNSIKIIGEETDNYVAGLLRLRLEEVGRRDDLAPALRRRGRSARPT